MKKLVFNVLFGSMITFTPVSLFGQSASWNTGTEYHFQPTSSSDLKLRFNSSQLIEYRSENRNYQRFTSGNLTTIDLGSNNTAYAQLMTNRGYFLFNKEIRSTNGQFGSNTGDLFLRTAGTNRVTIANITGFVGVNFTNPQHHIHVHGTTDFLESAKGDGLPFNHGISSRISLTNALTGSSNSDGAIIHLSEKTLHIRNRESDGLLTIRNHNTYFTMNNGRTYLNHGALTSDAGASFNIQSTNSQDNGLRVRVTTAGKYGILSVAGAEESAYLATTDPNVAPANINFKVTGGGEVYARKYTTTLATFPDYVFESDYNLLPLSELRNFISDNGRLPNMPSAQEIEENGADLGELNRLLVEKVEELTLYILEMEERLAKVEKKKRKK
jgi:hypothetical protein